MITAIHARRKQKDQLQAGHTIRRHLREPFVSSRGSPMAARYAKVARHLVRVSVWLLVLSLWASSGAAQSFDDAIAAYQNKDYVKALSIFEAVGNQGGAEAQYNAGQMYREGLGTKPNLARAMAWYRRAADQGFAPSQYDLGIMYAEGEGVRPDAKTALMWFRKSAEQGFVEAQVKLAEIAFASQDFKQAFFWWQKAADGGDANAMFNVGSAYYAGRGVAKNEAKAVEYYRKARDAGHPEAERILKQLKAVQ
jgi:TPR repeat protein